MQALKRFFSLPRRSLAAFWYILAVIVPIIVRTRRRPVIFSRHSGMGDIICTFPAAQALKQRHPGATFIYNCHPDFASLPAMVGVADFCTSTPWIGLVGHWYRFLLGGFYHFSHGDDTQDSAERRTMIREFGRQFGVTVDDTHPALPASPVALQRVRRLLEQKRAGERPLILIHPGPSWAVKEWLPERWDALIAELHRHGFKNIVQLGVGRYMNRGTVEVKPVAGVWSLVDQLTLEESIALISIGDLFVGIDSGLLHIAAAMRTPAVGIFGSTLPQLYYSNAYRDRFVTAKVDCAGCFHRHPRLHWLTGCPYDIKCMKSIGVEEVAQSCLSQLASLKE